MANEWHLCRVALIKEGEEEQNMWRTEREKLKAKLGRRTSQTEDKQLQIGEKSLKSGRDLSASGEQISVFPKNWTGLRHLPGHLQLEILVHPDITILSLSVYKTEIRWCWREKKSLTAFCKDSNQSCLWDCSHHRPIPSNSFSCPLLRCRVDLFIPLIAFTLFLPPLPPLRFYSLLLDFLLGEVIP